MFFTICDWRDSIQGKKSLKCLSDFDVDFLGWTDKHKAGLQFAVRHSRYLDMIFMLYLPLVLMKDDEF